MRRPAVVTLGPRPLDPDRRWMARVQAYEVDGDLWPIAVEIRMKAHPCAHDVEPADQPPEIEWERADCDCWPDALPGVEAVPSGGLPIRLLKGLRIRDFLRSYREAVSNLAQYVGLEHPNPAVAQHLSAMHEAVQRPLKTRGRPPAPPTLHLRRLAALSRAYDHGQTQEKAARDLGISAATLRATLAWGRAQQPPIWAPLGPGRAGQLTPHGRALVEAMDQQGRSS